MDVTFVLWTCSNKVERKCPACAGTAKQHYAVPSLQDVPDEMKGLSNACQNALKILVLHQGNVKKHRNGHLRKDQLSGVSWQNTSVQDRIALLQLPERRRAKLAYRWLLANCRGYRGWHDTHNKFLASGTDVHRLPPSALQEHYIEAAVWPHLYCLDEW